MPLPDNKIIVMTTTPCEGQKSGTHGLRKKVMEVKQNDYLENFFQCLLVTCGRRKNHLLLGGDGRYYNDVAIHTAIQLCAANSVAKLTVGLDGLISTPAVSHLIRKLKLDGGIILTASHSSGGETGDFGIKYNISNGSPAPTSFTNDIFERTKKIKEYKIARGLECDISKAGLHDFLVDGQPFQIEIINSVDHYVAMLKEIFDFPLIKEFIEKGFKIIVDCMSGVTGTYAKRIFQNELGAPSSAVINCTSKQDFGGKEPDTNPTHCLDLVSRMESSDFDFGAALDADGDRCMILGPKAYFVCPSDSLAILAENLDYIPHFQKSGVKGFARSMPTAAALDRVAEKHEKPIFVVPTGWKHFSNLLEKELISLCGEESFAIGSDHTREKDGIWAILAWLTVLAKKEMGVKEIVHEHWAKYGRNYSCRWDFEFCDQSLFNIMIADLEARVLSKDFVGKCFGTDVRSYTVAKAEIFRHTDPVDKSVSENEGLEIVFRDGTRLVFRVSGTQARYAMLRIYADHYEDSEERMHNRAHEYLEPIMKIGLEIVELKKHTGKEKPTLKI